MSNNYTLQPLLQNLDIPFSEEFYFPENHYSDNFINRAKNFINQNVIKSFWADCYPNESQLSEDSKSFEKLKLILTEGVSYGYKLNRFKEALKNGKNEFNFDSVFEEVVKKCEIRVYLSKEDYNNWIENQTLQMNKEETLSDQLELMNDGLFYELGIVYPPVKFKIDTSLQESFYRIEWNDFQFPPEKGISNEEILVNETVDRLTLLNIKGEKTINPASGNECAIIPSEYKEIAKQAALTTWNKSGYLILLLSSKIIRNAPAFVNKTFVRFQLSQLRKIFPETIREIENRFALEFIVKIVRGLLKEEISVRNFIDILDYLLLLQTPIYEDLSKYIVFLSSGNIIFSPRSNINDVELEEYVEMIRAHLKRYISHKYTRGGNTLVVYLMDPEIESRLKLQKDLNEAEKNELFDAIRYEIGELPPSAHNPVILTSMDVRRRLKNEISEQFPNLVILSYQELSPDMNIQPVARISLT